MLVYSDYSIVASESAGARHFLRLLLTTIVVWFRFLARKAGKSSAKLQANYRPPEGFQPDSLDSHFAVIPISKFGIYFAFRFLPGVLTAQSSASHPSHEFADKRRWN
jgi:hypothetical protein